MVGQYGERIQVAYDEATDLISITYYGGFGYGGPSPVFTGYDKIDDTHFVVNFVDVDYGNRQGQFDVELVDGNYIVTAKRYF